jgi:RHS repeat-associated protein
MKWLRLAFVLALAAPAAARTESVYREDFQQYASEASPQGWVESSMARPSRRRAATTPGGKLFRTWPDPLDGGNIAYGARNLSGELNGEQPRTGTFSTLSTIDFENNLDFSGRFFRTDTGTRLGLEFFSAVPDRDVYYLIALWPSSMKLFAGGAVADSAFTPDPGRWYRFRVLAQAIGNATLIQARFWPDGTLEPQAFSLFAVDSSPGRLARGRIGIWAAGRGEAYVDDLEARSEPVVESEVRVAFTSPAPDQLLRSARVTVAGSYANAAFVTVNGVPAQLDAATSTFTSTIDLLEGANTVSAVASNSAGESASASMSVTVDTRAPDLTVLSPAEAACLNGTAIEVRGRAVDRALQSVTISIGTNVVAAAIASDSTWAVTIPASAEARYALLIEAADALGHKTSVARAITIDRTPPAIEVQESGAVFTAAAINRPVTLLPRVTDADPNAIIGATLDGSPYAAGTPIVPEGEHELKVSASDCAGHSVQQTIRFTIDRTAAQILTIAPADGSMVGTRPSISGTTSPDASSILIEPAALTFPVENGAFTIADVPLAEGTNELTLTVIDRAGNRWQTRYVITLHSSVPAVEILDSGTPIADSAAFNRPVSPTIRVHDGSATVTATLNGSPFTSGTEIGEDGTHMLAVTATDAVGHSAEARVTFTIDRTPPEVQITAPVEGATVDGETVEVRGTAGAGAAAIFVNQIAVPLSGLTFTLALPLDIGPNEIVAVARDQAGNASADHVRVVRAAGPRGIILTFPPDGMITNRLTTAVTGQVLTSPEEANVTVGTQEVPVDPSGFFQKRDFALTEGENLIVASVENAGESSRVSVRVVADRLAPVLRLLESGQPLSDGATFATQAVVSAEATDGSETLMSQLTIDGALTPSPATITAPGGHAIVAIARDLAGNESRIERSIFIGSNEIGCSLSDFDPPSGAVVTSSSLTVTGRSGGAAGVKVNGTPAFVAHGSFCASVELPAEGDNTVSILCTDADGQPAGDSATLVLRRVTGDPSIAITAPEEGTLTSVDVIDVTGTISADVTAVEVNGVAATINGSAFTAAGVRLAGGLNVIVARARNGGGRIAAASRRLTHLKDAPSLTITSPAAALTTGAATIEVAGLWSHLDPATIAVAGASVETTRWNDTSGTFVARAVGLAPGSQTIGVTARDALGRTVAAGIGATRMPATPSIEISEPSDNSLLSAAAGAEFTVRGMIAAAPGSTVDVSGVAAVVDSAASTFTATVTFSSLPGGMTPVVARVIQPDGAESIDTARVLKLEEAPRVLEAFPPPAAEDIDRGAMPLVLFSAPMNGASLVTAFRLETSTGVPVTGALRVDRDVLTFAPAALLVPGGGYTIRVTHDARDIAGNPLQSEFTSSFTVISGAPSLAPTLVPIEASICAQQQEIRGMAPANARVRLDYGPLTLSADASPAGAFIFRVPLSGQSGCQVARVRVVGSDGSLSPAAEVRFQVDCNGPRVTAASFARATNRLSIAFSKEIDASTLVAGPAGSILMDVDGRIVGGTVTLQANVATVTPAEDLSQKSFTLTVTTAVQDGGGTKLAFPFTQAFMLEGDSSPRPTNGMGFISGEVFDASSGRPLAGATVAIETPSPISSTTDARGRYVAELPEGAHTLRFTADGFATAWRQIVVTAGSGVIPIDVRLPRRGVTQGMTASAMTLLHGGAALTVPPGAVPQGESISLTAIDAQSLPGLLPLGWSPLATAAVETDTPSLTGAQIAFNVAAAEVIAAGQTLTAAQYRQDRDEWQVIVPLVNLGTDGKVVLPIAGPGTFTLVYSDRAPSLARPPNPIAGASLQGVEDRCAGGACPPLTARSFIIDPPVVLPTGRAAATLTIEGAPPSVFPSGTAVQAYVDEELRLADGSRISDPPFTIDLLLYRSLAGDAAAGVLQLAPSARAAEVVLQVGFKNVLILPYPGRLDRGSLIGPEGGRVPGDGRVSIDIPAGSATEAMRATAATIADFAPFGSIEGFTIVGGFTLTLQRANSSDPGAAATLLAPARATFSGITSGTQHILVEVLDDTPYGRIYRLAAQLTPLPGGRIVTRPIDRGILPLDGISREGRYLLLAANAPIGFATGGVRIPASVFVSDAHVLAPPLGVTDLTRAGGLYALPVPAKPAAPFTLIPRTRSTGEGAAYRHDMAPDLDQVVRVSDLLLVPQPPALAGTTPRSDAVDVSLTTGVKATFAPAIDPASLDASSITVADAAGGLVSGRVTAEGTAGVVWTLPPGERLLPAYRYTVTIAPSIRGTNGTPFGRTHQFSFTTIARVVSTEVRREKIRITIPDEEGHSRIVGDPGALPAQWQSVATRRGVDFDPRPQATAASDGSFVIDLPGRITLQDLIDLQVVNLAGSVAAIFPLTPFVTEDGKGFIAPPDSDVQFTTPDGKTSVSVPAGAFDEPTVVTIEPAGKEAFASVPDIEKDLRFSTAVTVQFDGTAKKRLEIEIAAPPGASPDVPYYLGRLGQSVLGPRIEIVDWLRLDNGKLTTTLGDTRQNAGPAEAAVMRALKPATNQVLGTPQDAKNAMIATIRGGTYQASSFNEPTGFLLVDASSNASNSDLFSTSSNAVYVSSVSMTEKHGRVLFPVKANRPFQLVGYDASTGLETFRIDHTGIDALDPMNAAPMAIMSPKDIGPYPVFITPGRLEIVAVPPEGAVATSVRGLRITENNGVVAIEGGLPPLPAGTRVDVADVTNSRSGSSTSIPTGGRIEFPADTGDRLLIGIAEIDVDPEQNIAIAFSSPVDVPTGDQADEFLQDPSHDWIDILAGDDANSLTSVRKQARFRADPDARRIFVRLPLQRGRLYRLVLRGDLAGPSIGQTPGLKLAQRIVGTNRVPDDPADMYFDFRTRGPGGTIAEMTLPPGKGGIRDFGLIGNVALIATTGGGLQAFDVSDPAKLGNAANPPAIRAVEGATEFWSVMGDRHGRVFASGLNSMFGVVQSYRLEDFLKPPTSPPIVPVGGTVVSWRVGTTAGMPLGTQNIASDRPEAFPRRLQILLQDDEQQMTQAQLNPQNATPIPNSDFQKFDAMIVVPATSTKYWKQRVTVENRTIGARWSADVERGTSGLIKSIIARPGDELYLVRNEVTYGVVSLFGFGIGVFDLNAMESNDQAAGQQGYQQIKEGVLLDGLRGKIREDLVYPQPVFCDRAVPGPNDPPCVCNPGLTSPLGVACEIRDLSFTPDALIFPSESTSDINVYALEQNRGVLDVAITPPRDDPGPPPRVLPARSAPGFGISLSQPFFSSDISGNLYHPRLRSLHDLYVANASSRGRSPRARFTSISPYLRTDSTGRKENYALVAANTFGLMVLKMDGALYWEDLIDVIWIPAGAMSVRVIPRTDLALVVDGAGRVLLVDLRLIDESDQVAPIPTCSDAFCTAELFPTATASIRSATPPLPPNAYWIEVGVDDPRIVWKSDPGTVQGTIPPIIDPDSGILLAGDVNGSEVKAIAAIDPRVLFRIRTDDGPRFVNSIIPLGVAPKIPTRDPDSSYAAFRVEMTLPGSMVEALPPPREFRISLESERVFEGVMGQTPLPYPPAHLRNRRRDGTPEPRAPNSGFKMYRVMPETAGDPDLATLRYQRGYNRFVSPWIVAIADPRASVHYAWAATGSTPASAGCVECDRPASLANKTEADGVYEIYTTGRILAVRPETDLAGTAYAYLGTNLRLHARVSTIPADTVRPANVTVAAQNPPVSDGAVATPYYLHSGEIEIGGVDLVAGGRAAMNVAMDRTYRSRSLGLAPLGLGWDSSMFMRLRSLPNGNVELRDGSGDIRTFEAAGASYASPLGIYLSLTKTAGGWKLLDQQLRAAWFDPIGRLVARSDEFARPDEPLGDSAGNIIQYLYNKDGQLERIVDPVGRNSLLSYYDDSSATPGLLREVKDWRGRLVTYNYDAYGRLESVDGPEVGNVFVSTSFRGRPRTRYGYDTSAAAPPPLAPARNPQWTNFIEFSNHLESITDPAASRPRLTFEYDRGSDPVKRSRVRKETWATGEEASYAVTAAGAEVPTEVTVTDALGQIRVYELVSPHGRHVRKVTLKGVPTFEAGQDVKQAEHGSAPQDIDLITEISAFYDDGQIRKVKLPSGMEVERTRQPAAGSNLGFVTKGVVETAGSESLTTEIVYDGQPGAGNNPVAVRRSAGTSGAAARDQQVASRGRRFVRSNDEETMTERAYDQSGQLEKVAQKPPCAPAGPPGSCPPDAPAPGTESGVEEYRYYGVSDPEIARGRIRSITRPDNAVSLHFSYKDMGKGAERVTIDDAIRGSQTTIERDAAGRTIRQTVTGSGFPAVDEKSGYDANGLLTFVSREQQNLGTVETRFAHDAMLREEERSISNAFVNGVPSTVQVWTIYELGNRTITRTDPFVGTVPQAREVTLLDSLGRVAQIERKAPDDTVQWKYSLLYDKHGVSYESDGAREAVVRRRDAYGREILSIDWFGHRHEQTWDEWNQPIVEKWFDAGMTLQGGTPQLVGHLKRIFTTGGRLRAVNDELIAGSQFRQTRFAWEDGGKVTRQYSGAVGGLDAPSIGGSSRVLERTVDAAGRLTDEKVGHGSGITGLFTSGGIYHHRQTPLGAFSGLSPTTVLTSEPRVNSTTYSSNVYDAAGFLATHLGAGGYSVKRTFDQLGNVLTSEVVDHRSTESASYDSRGLLLAQTNRDQSTITSTYDALGNLVGYEDELGKKTTYETDKFGRVVKANYPDGTCEQTVFERGTDYVAATRDRAGQWLIYEYVGSRPWELRSGPVGLPSECAAPALTVAPPVVAPLYRYTFDLANRLKSIASTDAEVQYDEYDFAGRPNITRSVRYKDHTGLTTKDVLDVHTQQHVWSIFDGERDRYRMPVPGTMVPAIASASGWRAWIAETRDPVGNVTAQKDVLTASSAPVGDLLSTAFARGLGRLAYRQRPLGTGTRSLTAIYGYAEASSVAVDPDSNPIPEAPPPHSGLLGRAEFSVGTTRLAGGVITRDKARRIRIDTMIGMGERQSRFDFDDRDRLIESLLGSFNASASGGAPANPPKVTDDPNAVDFRMSRTVERLTASERATLGSAAPVVELPSFTAAPDSAHQIDALNRPGMQPTDLDFVLSGGRRAGDGVWNASYDAMGRLVQLTRNTPLAGHASRYEYDYNPLDRLVGRRVCSNTDANPCTLETDPTILARDGLPAHITLVWDAIADRLLAIFEAGKSSGASDEYAGLVRQYVHGDQGYDDPIEVLVATGAAGNPTRYLPILDEAGTGNLIAVVTDEGRLTERVFYGDSYGASPRYLHGPVVDRITRTVFRKPGGSIDEVRFLVHLSDKVVAASLPAGARLQALDAAGNVVRTATIPATIDSSDPFALVWALQEQEWDDLTSPIGSTTVEAVEVVITNALRCEGWGNVPPTALPAWLAQPPSLRSTSSEPAAARESLSAIAAAPGSVAETLLEVRDLYLVASEESRTRLFFGFGALPFVEPATGLIYARARWYDPSTGTFLTPDPSGYADSSNLYAYGGGDPINNSDPTGELCETSNASGVFSFAMRCGQDVSAVWQDFQLGVTKDVAEMGLNLVTVGGYGGVKQAYQEGKLDRGGLSGLDAYAGGVASFFTLGWYGTAMSAYEQGGTTGDATKAWAGNVSGYTDVAEGGTLLGEGEYLEGTGRILEGTGKFASILVGGRSLTAKVRGRPLQAFGQNIGASHGPGANRLNGKAAENFVAAREGTNLQGIYSATGGGRFTDVVVEKLMTRVGIEVKVGRQGLTRARGRRIGTRQQLARDFKLRRAGEFTQTPWEFFPSPITGLSGPSAQLAAKLRKLNIPYIVHPRGFNTASRIPFWALPWVSNGEP